MTLVKIKLDVKDAAYISANPTKVLALNEPIYRNDGLVAYGDGTTPLSGLTFLPLFSGGVTSVNTQTGDVVLDYSDVGADAAGSAADALVSANGYTDTGLATKQNSLGFTPENAANKKGTLTPGAVDFPNNDAVIAGLSTKVSVMVHTANGIFNPVNNQYYYFAHPAMAVTSTGVNTGTYSREIGCPVTGTIISVVVSLYVGNFSAASSTATNLYLRNTTAASLDLITNAITFNSALGLTKSITVTGLNIAVTRGDLVMSVLGNTIGATAPTTVAISVQYIIRP